MEPEKTDQDKLIKEAEAAAERASEVTEQVEEQHAEQAAIQPTSQAPAPEPKPLIVPDSVVVPSKQKHTARNVILVILTLLILGCIGLVVWFFAYYNNPEKVATDALQNFLTTENISASAHYEQSGDDAVSAEATLLASRHLPMSFNLNATINNSGDQQRLSAHLNIDSAGIIYANIDGISGLLGITDEVRAEADSLGEDAQTVISLVDDIDSETWRIDIPEIVDELGFGPELGKAYACIVDNIQHGPDTDAIISAYTDNQFVNIWEASDHSLFNNSYNLAINSTQLTNFLNAVAQDPSATQARHCFDGLDDATVSDKISESEVESVVGELPPINIKVDWFSHELTNITIKNNYVTLAANFVYPEKININMPEEYRPATELLDQFTDVISIYLGDYTVTADINTMELK